MFEALDIAVAAHALAAGSEMSLSSHGLVWSFVMRIDAVDVVSTSFWVNS